MRHLRRILWSFTFAFAGLSHLVRTQSNVWVHLSAAAGVAVLSAVLGIGGAELAVLVLAIGLVLVAEAVNTAVEAAVDLATPDVHPLARVAKDTSAAAVLLAALTAAVVGVLILAPRLFVGLRA
jgi:diacylglycerol kinase